MITYNLAPNPLWVLRDNTGLPLANGTMKTYRNTVRSQYKAVYQNMAGTVAWSQPIVFNAAGFQGEFYWASDENYYLEIYDSEGRLVRTVSDFNAPNDGGSTPVTVNVDFVNYINDPQFNYMRYLNFIPAAPGIQLGSSNWYFNNNNNSATDEINIVEFASGTTTPPSNPRYYFSYECSIAGSGETVKNLAYAWSDVYAFQGSEITLQFWAQSPTVANQVQIFFAQNFGTGGSPSPEVDTAVTSFTLTNTWAQYQCVITVPSISGMTLGTDNNSYCSIVFELPFNAISTIQITNVQVNDGNQYQPFGYLPAMNEATLQVPYFDALDYRSALPYIDDTGLLKWETATNVVEPVVQSLFAFVPIVGELLSTTVNPTETALPITQVSGASPWITGGQYKPTFACIALLNAYFVLAIDTPTEDSVLQVICYFNGSTVIGAQTINISDVNDTTAEFVMPIFTSFNGTTDYINFTATKSGSVGAVDVSAPYIFASNINNPL